MEKHQKSKNKFLKLLPKAASTAGLWQNPPFSPGRDVKPRANHRAHFSGQIVPVQSRLRGRTAAGEGFEAQDEPTSPKVSCIGQIKLKKAKSFCHQSRTKETATGGNVSKLKRIFTGTKPQKEKSEKRTDTRDSGKKAPPPPPPLRQMKRFASGRSAFSSFDWEGQISPGDIQGRDCFSDEERGQRMAREASMIPFSAPILVGDGIGVKPRKEVNLWKRRPMNPPGKLQIKAN